MYLLHDSISKNFPLTGSRHTVALINFIYTLLFVRFKDCMDDKKAMLLQLEHDDDDATGVICNGLKVSKYVTGALR